jgi:hypothetical protein
MATDINIGLTEFSTTKYHPLGYKFVTGRDVFRYAYNAGADTLVAGELVGGSQTTPGYGVLSGTATDILDSSSSTGIGLGEAMSAAPTANYFWVHTSGPSRNAMTSDGNVAAGTTLGMGGTTSPDGTVIPIADGTEENTIGYATAADSGTTCAAGTIILGCERWW